RHRLGLHARTDGPRGPQRGATRETRHARVQGCVPTTARDLSDGYAARPGGLLAHWPVRGPGGSGEGRRGEKARHHARSAQSGVARSAQTQVTNSLQLDVRRFWVKSVVSVGSAAASVIRVVAQV